MLWRPGGRLGRRRAGSEGKGGFGGLGTLWRDKREEPDYKTRTHTLKGTRVTSSNGDNYIILSPVNPGSQVMMMMMMISRMFWSLYIQGHLLIRLSTSRREYWPGGRWFRLC